MKNKILLAVISCLVLTTSWAQPKKVLADKIVGVVGNKVVLKSDIDNSIIDMQRQGMELPPDARCLTLEQSMGIDAPHTGQGKDAPLSSFQLPAARASGARNGVQCI